MLLLLLCEQRQQVRRAAATVARAASRGAAVETPHLGRRGDPEGGRLYRGAPQLLLAAAVASAEILSGTEETLGHCQRGDDAAAPLVVAAAPAAAVEQDMGENLQKKHGARSQANAVHAAAADFADFVAVAAAGWIASAGALVAGLHAHDSVVVGAPIAAAAAAADTAAAQATAVGKQQQGNPLQRMAARKMIFVVDTYNLD